MKTTLKITAFSAILLILAGGFVSCKDEDSLSVFPLEVSFTEYFLLSAADGGSLIEPNACQWAGLEYSQGELVIINSDRELQNNLECLGQANYEEINFSEYTLLLAKGVAPNGISDIQKSLQQLSESDYRLDIEIRLNDAVTDVQSWAVALIVDKLKEESIINGSVTYPDGPYLMLDKTHIQATAEAGTYSATVRSNSAWTAVVEDAEGHAWCTLISASGNIYENSALTLSVTENTTSSERSAVVKITSGNITKTLTISQYADGSEISFTDYSLEGSSCEWQRFQGDYYSNEVVIINSDERLASYVDCAEKSNYSGIDFTKYTLLLVRGVEGHSVTPDYKEVQQLSAKNYVLKVNLLPGAASVITYWAVPIMIPKIADDVEFELVVTKN